MSIKALNWAFESNIPSSGAKLTLLALANYASAEDCSTFSSQRTISRLTSLSTRAIRNHLAWLEKMGFIERTSRKRDDGTFTSDLFVLKVGSNGIGNNCQRQILPSAENVEIQRQILPNPAADFAGHDTLLNTTLRTEPIEKEKYKKEKETVQPSGFTEFWNSYPAHPRKGGKAKCLKIWISRKLENKAQQILDHLAWQKKDWARSNNEYVQMPSSYLNAAKWDGWVDMGEQKRERGFVV